MKNKITAIFVLMLALLLVVALSSCGEPTNTDTNTNTETNTEAITQTESDRGTATETDGDTSVEDSTDTDSDTGTDVESDTGVDSESDTNTETNTDTETEPDEPKHVHVEEIIAGVEPTCTETGLTEGKKCSKCGEILVEQTVVDAKGHTEEIIAGVEHTCTETGLAEGKKCSECGEILVEQEMVDAKGHTEEILPAVTPTCTETGLTEGKKCSECGEILVEQEIVPAAHKEETIPAVEPTCTETGLTEGKKCSACGEILVEQKIIKAQHTYNGSYECTRCDYFLPTSEGLEFTLNSETDTYTVSGIGTCKDANIVIPYTYEGKAVTSIGGSAFEDCDSLKSITIPDSVTSIGNYAFRYCECLTSVTIPNSITSIGDYAFSGCKSLTSITIPNSVTSIGNSAFSGCTALTEINFNAIAMEDLSSSSSVFHNAGQNGKGIKVTIGKDVTKIPAYLFCPSRYSPKIKSVTFEEDSVCESIGTCAFNGCTKLTSITIPDSVTSIGKNAFSYCESWKSVNYLGTIEQWCNIEFGDYGANPLRNGASLSINGELLTELVIPDTVTKINNYLGGCTSLTSITIPSSVTSIGDYAFSGCDNLKSITIPDSVTTIGERAFFNCTSLTSIVIPDSVTTIGERAFQGCASPASVNYLGTIEQWCNISFENYSANPLDNAKNLYIDGELVTNIVISDTVTEIKDFAFYKCASLTSIVIPDSVTTIGEMAFFNCTSLTSVEIGDSVMTIGNRAFEGCTSLTSIKIPDSVTSIGGAAFYNCTSLTSVEIGDSVMSIGGVAFYNCTSLTSIEIPDSVTSIGREAFYSCTSLTEINFNAVAMDDLSSYNEVFFNAGKNGEGIKVTIGKEVTKIPAYLFNSYSISSYSPKITSVEFEDGSKCESIGDCAFSGCTSLTSIVIPDSVTTIGHSAFSGCTSLTRIVIPDSVTSIGEYAFAYCTLLTIYCEATSKPSDWDSNWNYSNCLVVWDCNNNDVADDGYIYTLIDGIRYGIKDNAATVTSRQPVFIKDIKKAIIRNDVTYKGETYPVTTIEEYAFYGCTALESITIGNSVTTIGDGAFYGCTQLTEINFNAVAMKDLSSGSNVFYNAGENGEGIKVTIGKEVTKIPAYLFNSSNSSSYTPKITSVEFEEGSACESIGVAAFYGCSKLTCITIPDSVKTIGNSAFSSCTSLESVTIGKGVTSIGNNAFEGCASLTSVEIGDSVTTIGSHAFEGCTSLTSIEIPDSVTLIEFCAFYGCTSLESATIGNSVTSIGIGAFDDCTSLTEINFNAVAMDDLSSYDYVFECAGKEGEGIKVAIGKEVTKIPAYLFNPSNSSSYTPKITSVEFEDDSVCESIGSYAFSCCDSLTSIEIPDSVTTIGSYAFSGCELLDTINFNAVAMKDLSSGSNVFYNAGENGEGIKVTIGKDVTKIPAYLFGFAYYITSVVFEEGSKCESIGECAFSCSKHTCITIPDSVKTIGNSAFSSCTSLESVTIGKGVTSIGSWAFNNCNSLTSVVFKEGSACESIGDYAFSECHSLITSIVIPNSVTSIGQCVFLNCHSLESVIFENTNGWYVTWTEGETSECDVDVTDASFNVTLLEGECYLYRKQ